MNSYQCRQYPGPTSPDVSVSALGRRAGAGPQGTAGAPDLGRGELVGAGGAVGECGNGEWSLEIMSRDSE